MLTHNKLRLTITRLTPNYIYATYGVFRELGGLRELGELRNLRELRIDWSAPHFHYLRKILKPGTQINILDSTQLIPNAVLFPKYIIVEPDFLLDISSIAACFKEYGHHPLNYTISRLSKAETTQPILLGNYAGAALDAALTPALSLKGEGVEKIAPSAETSKGTVKDNTLSAETDKGNYKAPSPFRERVGVRAVLSRCFQSQPLEYITCPDFNPQQFKRDAIAQAQNIKEIIAALRENYDLDKAILEPTFVCEALGIQGRVDMMTTDFRLLIEQKSGKNFNLAISHLTDIGYHVESHYVQLLLYFSVLYFNFGVKREDIDFFLLYSKYAMPTGLLPVEYHDQLISEALKLRNQIVATELLIADRGFQTIRPLLRPDVVNTKHTQSTLWTRYQKPQLDELLNTLTPALSLKGEGAEMIALSAETGKGNILSPETGKGTVKDNILSAEPDKGNNKAPSPFRERDGVRAYFDAMATFIYREQRASWLSDSNDQTTAVSYLWRMSFEEKLETGNILPALTLLSVQDTHLTLQLTHPDILPNFRRGDSVYLYQYTDIPDVRRAFLHKANITKLTSTTVSLALRNPLPASVHSDSVAGSWAIEHSSTNSSTTSSLRSLNAFLNADSRRQDLLLAQRAPEADLTQSLSRSYSPDYDDIVLRMKQAKDYFLLIGPPGTGKTSQALKFMVQENMGQGALLLLSYTNRAVDEICEMLHSAGLDFLRIGNEFATDEQWQPYLLQSIASQTNSFEKLKSAILDAPIIVGTTSMISARTYLFSLKHFSLAIIDEASQILEPNIIGILSQPIDKFVLIGDYKQLPAVVQQSPEESRVKTPLLNDICLTDCRNSLFERLINIERKAGRTQFVGLLRKQGRMHPDIAAFANEHFYKEENLQPVPLPHQLESSGGRMLFYDVKKEGQSQNPKTNLAEAALAAKLVEEIRQEYGDDFNPRKTVGIIVPYRNQITTIRKELEKYNCPDYERISIDTVERYQGSQRDMIIYSFTFSHPSQLNFLTANTFYEDGRPIDRKLNVAITRARKQFIAIGDKSILSQNLLFKKLIEHSTAQPHSL